MPPECNDANETSAAQNASPSITTEASGPVTVGDAIHDVATLSGAFGTPDKSKVTFDVFAPGDTTCATSVATLASASNVGTVYTSADYTTTQSGVYRWIAHFAGDANNNPFDTKCNDANETSTANSRETTVDTAQHVTISDTARANGVFGTGTECSGNPDPNCGTVSFELFDQADCNGNVIFSDTQPLDPNTFEALTAGKMVSTDGTYSWNVTYNGDNNNTASPPNCEESTTVSGNTDGLATLRHRERDTLA